VFVAVARRGQAPEQVEVRPLVLLGDRQQIRRQTVAAALGLLSEVVADVVAETAAAPSETPATAGTEDSGSSAR